MATVNKYPIRKELTEDNSIYQDRSRQIILGEGNKLNDYFNNPGKPAGSEYKQPKYKGNNSEE